MSTLDVRMMKRALRAAERGDPSPNPHVGAVLARGDQVISVGYHACCGQAHAEVDAIRRAAGSVRGATLYVTLEPCNHHGRTPPCTEAILAAGIERVVVGCEDPAPHVPGSARRLRRAGVEVVVGVERERARAMIVDFEKFMLHGLPYVTLTAAATLAGREAARSGNAKRPGGRAAGRSAHHLRAQADAVLVGVGTVLADDPELTDGLGRGRIPLRVVLDTQLRTPPCSRLVSTAPQVRTLILHGKAASPVRARRLAEAGVELARVRTSACGRLALRDVLRTLARRDVVRLLVAGGAGVHGAFLDAGLADRVDDSVLVVGPLLRRA
ncbi:MAG TPA: bifunctional diaminohydroxyphosphoribosylaminopyrimidine deaminase/5-amino-6-(5-phosphoribosylamino)uracil reductase RibD [Polyangiales bacterium]